MSKKDAKDGIAAIKFGKIHYTAAGTYKYEIRENAGNTVGMTYDSHVATAEVTVTEDGDGNLTANVTKKENGRFTNTYRTELNYTAAGGLWLSKYLDGRPMTEGQFTFTVTPADDASGSRARSAARGQQLQVSRSGRGNGRTDRHSGWS